MLKLILCSLLLSLSLTSHVFSQACPKPEIVSNKDNFNFFSAEDEEVWGKLMFERLSDQIRPFKDKRVQANLERIGDRLVRHLPDTGLTYKFLLVDMPDTNAFNFPGGYVIVSRKIVALARDEDELAGLLAHELGHAVVRHGSSDMSYYLKELFDVSSFKGPEDVEARYNQFIEGIRTKRIKPLRRDHGSTQQLEADRFGVYAMTAAGYNPEAFAKFWDRLTENQGKRGNWFSRLLGNESLSTKRYRKLLKEVKQLPPGCIDTNRTENSVDFQEWQAQVVAYRNVRQEARLNGLLYKGVLEPKLRSDIRHLQVGPNEKYLLAQDDFAVTILELDPLKVVFQFPAENAKDARFMGDGKHVVFTTRSNRYERWSIDRQKPVEIREVAFGRKCFDNELSPDGKNLVCVDGEGHLIVIDSYSGDVKLKLKNKFRIATYEYLAYLFSLGGSGGSFYNITFPPNSKTVVVSRSDRFRVRLGGSSVSQDQAIGVDLEKMKEFSIANNLDDYLARPFVFIDENKIVAMHTRKNKQSGIFSFPDGKRLSQFELGGRVLKKTANPKYVVIKPLGKEKMGIFNIETGKLATGMTKDDATMWNNKVIYESKAGTLMVRDVVEDKDKPQFIGKEFVESELPVSSLGRIYGVSLSDQFRVLGFSSRSRGGVWDARTGKRKMLVRGFYNSSFADNGVGVASVRKDETVDSSLVYLNATKNETRMIKKIPSRGVRQIGSVILKRTSLEKDKRKDKDEEPDRRPLGRNVKFELEDYMRGKVLWSRTFKERAPVYSFDGTTGRMIFRWRVGSKEGQKELQKYPALLEKAKKLEDDEDNYFVEIFEPLNKNNVVGKLIVETGNRSFAIGRGSSFGNFAIFYDSEGRILVYSLSTGNLLYRFIGNYAIENPARNLLFLENYPGEVKIYNLNDGSVVGDLVFPDDVALARFNPNGRALFVMTKSQQYFAFDLDKMATQLP